MKVASMLFKPLDYRYPVMYECSRYMMNTKQPIYGEPELH